MSDYVYGTTLSYRDYLQARSFERSFHAAIQTQTRSMIASAEELHRERISSNEAIAGRIEGRLQDVSAALSSGFEDISMRLDDLSSDVRELNATCHWGFTNLLAVVTSVNDSLQALIRISKSPAQTWAYEQFEIARDAYRQDLFPEAVQYLERAIGGFGANTGYRLEHRFHFLLGTIRLGSTKHTDTAILDLSLAEQSFLNAARYARRDNPKEAGHAFLAAGWAAYCQGKMDLAREHTLAAAESHPQLAEAHFQVAKVLMHVGDAGAALPPLRRAIGLDRRYALKAASDGDFQAHEAKLDMFLETLRGEASTRAKDALEDLHKKIQRTAAIDVPPYSFAVYGDLSAARADLTAATQAHRAGTFFGLLDAISHCANGVASTGAARSAFEASVNAICSSRLQDIAARTSELEGPVPTKESETLANVAMVIGLIVSMAFGCHAYKGTPGFFSGIGAWITQMFWGLVASGVIAAVLYQIQKGLTRNARERELGALREEEATRGAVLQALAALP